MASTKANTVWRKTVIQFLKYMVGGGVYFWSGYAVFALFYSGIGWSLVPAKMMADGVGWSLNYFIQRYWAFGNTSKKMSETQHVGRYLTIEAIGFVLDYLLIVGLNAAGITPYIGFFISAGLFTVWSYFWYRFWVFPEQYRGK